MKIDLFDTTEDGVEIPVTCEVEFDEDCYEVQHIRYGDVTYPSLEDLKADFPDCAQELDGMINVEWDEWYYNLQDRKFYGDWEINDER